MPKAPTLLTDKIKIDKSYSGSNHVSDVTGEIPLVSTFNSNSFPTYDAYDISILHHVRTKHSEATDTSEPK